MCPNYVPIFSLSTLLTYTSSCSFKKVKIWELKKFPFLSLQEAYSFCVRTEQDYEDRIRRAVFTLADEREVCFSSQLWIFGIECKKGQNVYKERCAI